ncbi:hypothetical protein F3Y22_tig00001349pilonHSYRG00017 [Hibiscus syriacus]|uniref:RNase H type-1 domain-containing protein n=1 Tax=Hibiscus syriacus TaxID=106335 RepID=A0A6A3CVF7_HIBSY|nr:hypothetical protein F3Y22_tig00001349pilonHSYRG00017 [Hibiscus syriacus]
MGLKCCHLHLWRDQIPFPDEDQRVTKKVRNKELNDDRIEEDHNGIEMQSNVNSNGEGTRQQEKQSYASVVTNQLKQSMMLFRFRLWMRWWFWMVNVSGNNGYTHVLMEGPWTISDATYGSTMESYIFHIRKTSIAGWDIQVDPKKAQEFQTLQQINVIAIKDGVIPQVTEHHNAKATGNHSAVTILEDSWLHVASKNTRNKGNKRKEGSLPVMGALETITEEVIIPDGENANPNLPHLCEPQVEKRKLVCKYLINIDPGEKKLGFWVVILTPSFGSIKGMEVHVVDQESIDNGNIIAQEVVHSMRLKRRKIGYMAIKIDLEKAYDRLEWPFIDDTLKELRIPDKLRILIMRCVSSVDPAGAVNNSRWKPIRLCRNEPVLSHLFFAYDLVLLAEAYIEQCNVIRVKTEKLEDFCTRDIKNWMQINITSPGFYAREDNDWDLQFGSILWRLTLEANRAMESSLPTIHLSHRPCTIHDAWQPPPHNWCKINTYASCNIRSGFASCGGVFRSSNGGWMFGFSKVIGICSIVEVELWGIHEGLSHAWNLGERLITVETDSLEAVRMLKHISRNANKVMDRLAKIVATRGEVHMVFSTPPLEVIDFIQQEAEDYTLTELNHL